MLLRTSRAVVALGKCKTRRLNTLLKTRCDRVLKGCGSPAAP
jgi:hypothetical protein